MNILKGHRDEMCLMVGFDFWLIATSNRPGNSGTGDGDDTRTGGREA